MIVAVFAASMAMAAPAGELVLLNPGQTPAALSARMSSVARCEEKIQQAATTTPQTWKPGEHPDAGLVQEWKPAEHPEADYYRTLIKMGPDGCAVPVPVSEKIITNQKPSSGK